MNSIDNINHSDDKVNSDLQSVFDEGLFIKDDV